MTPQVDPTAAPQPDRQPGEGKLRLFVKMPSPETNPPPSWLAQRLGLHLSSTVLLGKRSRIEMNFAAGLLVIVGVFELCAWGFLFNAIFNSDIYYLGFGTIGALLVACLFASVVFWFERQLLTFDEADKQHVNRAMWVRFTYILISAAITSQPIELLAFRQPISERVHAEEIREKAALTLGALLQDEGRDQEGSDLREHQPAGDRDRAQKRLDEAVDSETKLSRQLSAQEGEARWLDGEVTRLQADRDRASSEDDRQRLQGELDRNSSRLESVRRQIERLNGLILAAREQASQFTKVTGDAESARQKIRGEFLQRQELDHILFREWVAALRDAKPGQPVQGADLPSAKHYASPDPIPLERARRWSHQDSLYSVYEQLRVLYDLVLTRPPRWLTGSPEVVHQLETDYGLRTPRPCDDEAPQQAATTSSKARLATAAATPAGAPATSTADERAGSAEPPPCDPREWQNEVARSRIYKDSFVALLFAALLIPLLVLTMKLVLMPEHLRRYYSSRHQAAAGDPDALFAAMVEERVHEQTSGESH